jgi:GntR family transcriptional regulator/MocR family aminotransferase
VFIFVQSWLFPTTVSLTAERRLKLLQLAKEYQFAIIEDDYDYDFQFEGLAMLYGQLRCKWNGNLFGKLDTVFISKFSNRICSSPENLISEAKNYLQCWTAKAI